MAFVEIETGRNAAKTVVNLDTIETARQEPGGQLELCMSSGKTLSSPTMTYDDFKALVVRERRPGPGGDLAVRDDKPKSNPVSDAAEAKARDEKVREDREKAEAARVSKAPSPTIHEAANFVPNAAPTPAPKG